jgi:two-component system, NarL family, sensor kinase
MNFWTIFTLIAAVLLTLGLNLVLIKWYLRRRDSATLALRDLELAYETHLKSAKIETQEYLLQQVSLELHDNIAQVLSIARLTINTLDQSTPRQEETVSRLDQLLDKALIDLRNLNHSMFVVNNEVLLLSAKIKEHVQWFRHRYQVDFKLEGEEVPINPEINIVLYRMIQEVIRNVAKYANATTIKILLAYFRDQLTITIEDDGKGFDLDMAVGTRKGSGLYMLYERAKLINAELIIDTKTGSGTKVTINARTQ